MSKKKEKYSVVGTVGEGAHGIVLQAIHVPSNEVVALKKITIKKIGEGIPVSVIREIKGLQYIQRHENIVHLRDLYPQGLSVVLVFEYLPSNLWEILDAYKLNPSQIKTYTKMILNGLSFIHSNNIIHRDLKPANLLISEEGILKIGDFGLCRLHFKDKPPRAYSHQVATRWYRPPELLYGARFYDEGVDLWSVGCIVAEMIKGEPLFQGENDIDQLYKVISSLGTPNEEIWPGHTELPDYNKITFSKMCPIPLKDLVPSSIPMAVEFLSRFLLYNSSKRISASNALKHEFLNRSPLPCPIQDLPKNPPPKSNNQVFKDFDIEVAPATPSTEDED